MLDFPFGKLAMTLDVLEVDLMTGERNSIASSMRRALRALNASDVPYAVIGATALGVRGLPRNTRDLDVVVLLEDAFAALDALTDAGFHSVAPIDRDDEPEPMYVLHHGADEVDLLVAAAEPESTVVAEATKATVFGVDAPVASLEHLVLMYLYSNQARHLGDLARIVTESEVDLPKVERYLADVHPEMLEVLRDRVQFARKPPPAPARPPRRRR
ncbi:MAG TPA: hypothetical protein VNO21_28130 [Polyangiaceae bacterium]|nr:hypothetical protein [Polyangiaceae bacterium]